MTQPLVSICIPLFNCENYIKEALDSIKNQTYDNIEVIICDDQSHDRSAEISRTYAQQNPDLDIKVFESDVNRGLESNWNWSISKAKGKYIKLLPSDDYLYPECISRQVEAFEDSGEKISLVFCCRQIINKNGKPIVQTGPKKSGRVKARDLLELCLLRGTNVMGEPGAVLFERSTAEKVGEFNGTLPYVIDLDYWMRLLDHGDGYALADPLCTFRIDQNLSVRLGLKRPKNFNALMARMAEKHNFGKTARFTGKLRTYFNELLRRTFYAYLHITSR